MDSWKSWEMLKIYVDHFLSLIICLLILNVIMRLYMFAIIECDYAAV